MANDFHLPTLLGFADVQALAVCDVDSNRRAHGKKRVEVPKAELIAIFGRDLEVLKTMLRDAGMR